MWSRVVGSGDGNWLEWSLDHIWRCLYTWLSSWHVHALGLSRLLDILNWKSTLLNWKSTLLKWNSTLLDWNSALLKWNSTLLKWNSTLLDWNHTLLDWNHTCLLYTSDAADE